MLYIGAEYCPICATERWPMLVALSHFGTFTGISQTHSAVGDGNIATITFYGSTFTSPYLTFSGVEQYTNVPAPGASPPYTSLQNPTKEELAVLAKYSSSKFLPNASTSVGISFPSSVASPSVGIVLPKITPSEVSTTSSVSLRPPNFPPVAPPVSTPR